MPSIFGSSISIQDCFPISSMSKLTLIPFQNNSLGQFNIQWSRLCHWFLLCVTVLLAHCPPHGPLPSLALTVFTPVALPATDQPCLPSSEDPSPPPIHPCCPSLCLYTGFPTSPLTSVAPRILYYHVIFKVAVPALCCHSHPESLVFGSKPNYLSPKLCIPVAASVFETTTTTSLIQKVITALSSLLFLPDMQLFASLCLFSLPRLFSYFLSSLRRCPQLRT